MAWLDDDPEDELEETQGPTRMTAFYIGIGLLPVIFLFDHLGRIDLGLNLFLALSVDAIVIRTRWELKKYAWFWAVMASIAAVEVPIVLGVKWPRQWVPAVALLPIWLGGYMIAMGAIRLVEHFMKPPPPDEEA
jgi:hypothetical protein